MEPEEGDGTRTSEECTTDQSDLDLFFLSSFENYSSYAIEKRPSAVP